MEDMSAQRRHFDSGWLFILAGGAMISAMVLIPAADNLTQLQGRRDHLQARVNAETRRLEAYGSFYDALNREDPMLVRRLAASELNLIPDDAEPVAMLEETGDGLDASIDGWIERTLDEPGVEYGGVAGGEARGEPRVTVLRRLASGGSRLWIMIAGVAAVFVGLLPPMRGGKSG